MDCGFKHGNTSWAHSSLYTLYAELCVVRHNKTPNSIKETRGNPVSDSYISPHFQCQWKPNFPTLLRSFYPVFLFRSKSHSALYPRLSCHYDVPLWFFRRMSSLQSFISIFHCFKTSDKVLKRSLITKDKPFWHWDLLFWSLKSKKKNSVLISGVTSLKRNKIKEWDTCKGF